MALENRIRPVFVGRGFGNYDDRFERDDARYILTYGLPKIGYESQPGLIQEILDRYPNRRVIAKFEIDETPGTDQAWLIEKTPDPLLAASLRIESCARLVKRRSRRTRIAAFVPNTTTRCSSTTAAPRSSPFSSARVWKSTAASSTPAAAAAACRSHSPSTPMKSSASIPSIGSARRDRASRASGA